MSINSCTWVHLAEHAVLSQSQLPGGQVEPVADNTIHLREAMTSSRGSQLWHMLCSSQLLQHGSLMEAAPAGMSGGFQILERRATANHTSPLCSVRHGARVVHSTNLSTASMLPWCRWDAGHAAEQVGGVSVAKQHLADLFTNVLRKVGLATQAVVDFACTKVGAPAGHSKQSSQLWT